MDTYLAIILGVLIVIGEMSEVSSVNESSNKNNKWLARQIILQTAAWRLVYEPCRASCGGGYQRSKAMCMKGDMRIDDAECAGDKPQELAKPCGQQPCFVPRWLPFQYSDCTVTCGKGDIYIPRIAKCFIQTTSNGVKSIIEVAERMCPPDRPPIEPSKCPTLPTCPPTVAKIDTRGNAACPNPPCNSDPKQGSSAHRSAVELTLLIGLTSFSAFLIRIYLFNS